MQSGMVGVCLLLLPRFPTTLLFSRWIAGSISLSVGIDRGARAEPARDPGRSPDPGSEREIRPTLGGGGDYRGIVPPTGFWQKTEGFCAHLADIKKRLQKNTRIYAPSWRTFRYRQGVQVWVARPYTARAPSCHSLTIPLATTRLIPEAKTPSLMPALSA